MYKLFKIKTYKIKLNKIKKTYILNIFQFINFDNLKKLKTLY